MKELPNEEDIEMETNPSYMSVVPAIQGGGGGVERSGVINYENVGLG